MAGKIDGIESRPTRIVAGNATQRAQAATEAAARQAQPRAAAAAAPDVQITGAARTLAALEGSLREQPAVDEARVAEVQRKLDDGSYEVSPERIADSLLKMERDLRTGQPVRGKT
jgi:negative regulator of flagellin synthesis FlgM